jgi:hypothetical protein
MTTEPQGRCTRLCSVKDLVVVHTSDVAVIVVPRSRVQDVRDLVNRFKRRSIVIAPNTGL